MKDNTEGAWIIHHTKKLLQVQTANPFDEIQTAGKCGLLLSSLAASDTSSNIESEKVKVIAKSVGLTPLELPAVLEKLKDSDLLDTSSDGSVEILGLTTSSILGHTSTLFKKSNPTSSEIAAIVAAEKVSHSPVEYGKLKEELSDIYKLSNEQSSDLLEIIEDIGFVDSESIDDKDEKLIFNGNLFKREFISKTQKILSSLSSEEQKKVKEADELLNSKGCLPLEALIKVLGNPLLSKLQSIGMYELSEVANETESKTFATKPAAFNKFGNPFEDDAMDLAKAFVASLAYGMNFSTPGRGKISMLKALMRKLIAGNYVGPATAIGQDYKILEHKRVVQLIHHSGSRFSMKLLKRDIGVLALHVLELGEVAAEESLVELHSGNMTKFTHPEGKREQTRKKRQTKESKIQIVESLRTLRF